MARFVLILIISCAGSLARGEGRLQSIRDEASTPDPSGSRSRSYSRQDDCDSWGDELWGELIAGVVAAPFVIPHQVLDWPDSKSFSAYPYENDVTGYMAPDWLDATSAKPWSARLRGEFGQDFNDIELAGGGIQIDSPFVRMTFDSSLSEFEEQVATGTDALTVGDANLTFRFVQSPRSVWRSGVGVNWLSGGGSEVGFNFTYAVDYFPRRPWIVSAEIDWGRLGEASLFHTRATVGVQVRDWEFYSGFDYVDIAETSLGNLVAGLRYWW